MMKPWTKSLLLSAVILAAGGALALSRGPRLASVRKERQALLEKADRLGISTDDFAGDPRITKRRRVESGAAGAEALAGLLGYAKELQAHREGGTELRGDFEKRGRELVLRLTSLDSAELKQVIAGLRDATDIGEAARAGMISFAIGMLGEDRPAAALEIYADCAGTLGDFEVGRRAVAVSLENWAKIDPAAALAWVAAHPDIAGDDAKTSILAGVAENDPAGALRLLDGLDIEDPSAAVESLAETAEDADQRTALIDAIRSRLASHPEDGGMLDDALQAMGRNAGDGDFAATTGWISTTKLTPEESAAFAGGLSYFTTKAETGLWIDWMAANLPPGDAAESAGDLIGQWTQEDYLAAGKWLAAAPDSAVKTSAVASYAETVADTDPQTAVLWLETLPPGELRQETLETVYQNWPRKDAAGRDGFAKKYGLGGK